MKGWLVVNGYLKSGKFFELYTYFLNSAKQLNIELELVPTNKLIVPGGGFCNVAKPDFVLFWDKDVCLAKRMERAGFRLFNSAEAVETCDSKTLTALKLQGVVEMPQTLFSPKTFPNVGYADLTFVEKAADLFGLPLVIKESYGSFGEQVYLANTVDEAKALVEKLAGKDFVIQKFVAESRGRDIRLNVVGGKVVNAILRSSATDFRSNITLGGAMSAYQPTAQEVEIAEKACKTIGLDFAGADVLFGKDGPLLCEVNSNPHFKTTFDCTGVDLSNLILRHIRQTLESR